MLLASATSREYAGRYGSGAAHNCRIGDRSCPRPRRSLGFHPQTGFLLHNAVQWRVSGIMFELGLPTFLVVATLTTIATFVSRPRASHHH